MVTSSGNFVTKNTVDVTFYTVFVTTKGFAVTFDTTNVTATAVFVTKVLENVTNTTAEASKNVLDGPETVAEWVSCAAVAFIVLSLLPTFASLLYFCNKNIK